MVIIAMTTNSIPHSRRELIPEGVIEELAFLTRSVTRVHILEIANQQQLTTRQELRDQLDVSRSTIQRTVDSLVEQGWLDETPDGYEITLCGELLCSHISDLADSVQTLQRLQPLLRHVSLDELDIPITYLENGSITVASEEDPYAPVNRHVDALKNAGEFRGCTSVIGRPAMKQIYDRVTNHGGECEIILTAESLDTVQSSPSYADIYEEITQTDNVEVFVYHGDLPYYLGIIDGLVQIGIENNSGVPQAIFETESGAMKQWAEEKYTAMKRQSQSVT